jgi:predicted DNA-binding protein (MmcQ/YjbR family)
MPDRILDHLQRICLAHPQAEERLTWDEPTFRIRDKIFCIYSDHDDRPALTCKAPRGSQAVLVGADGKRFFVPRYVGHIGWIGMWLDGRVDWDEVATIVARSFAMTAPKQLAVKKVKAPAAKVTKGRSASNRRPGGDRKVDDDD